MFSNLGKLLEMQDIEIGEVAFDDTFIIKSTDGAKLRSLFANEKLRQLILVQPYVYLEVKDNEGWFGATFPEGVDELYFQVPGVIADVERLKLLFALFAETLHQLCHIGSAYKNGPQVML